MKLWVNGDSHMLGGNENGFEHFGEQREGTLQLKMNRHDDSAVPLTGVSHRKSKSQRERKTKHIGLLYRETRREKLSFGEKQRLMVEPVFPQNLQRTANLRVNKYKDLEGTWGNNQRN